MSSFTSVGKLMTLFQVSWMDQNRRSAWKRHSFTPKAYSHLEGRAYKTAWADTADVACLSRDA